MIGLPKVHANRRFRNNFVMTIGHPLHYIGKEDLEHRRLEKEAVIRQRHEEQKSGDGSDEVINSLDGKVVIWKVGMIYGIQCLVISTIYSIW